MVERAILGPSAAVDQHDYGIRPGSGGGQVEVAEGVGGSAVVDAQRDARHRWFGIDGDRGGDRSFGGGVADDDGNDRECRCHREYLGSAKDASGFHSDYPSATTSRATAAVG